MLKTFLVSTFFAMVFLGTTTANAYYWRCNGEIRAIEKVTEHRATWSVSGAFEAPDRPSAMLAAKQKFHERPDAAKYARWETVVWDCARRVPKPQPPKPAPVPLPAPIVPPKPASRDWVCRVKLRWHLDAKSKDVDETITIDDATGQTDAEGKAIYRIQQRQRALFRDADGRRMTFSQTTVTCT